MVLGMRGIRDISPLWLNRVVHMVMEREKEKGGEHRGCCSAKSVPFPPLTPSRSPCHGAINTHGESFPSANPPEGASPFAR